MRAEAYFRYQGVALENAGGEVADALQRVVTAYTGGLTFRAISQSPWIEIGHDTGHIECTTCGSSGIPKVIRRPFITWQKTFDLNRQLFGLTAGDRSAIFGGLNHSLALYGVCESLHLGMECDFVTGMRPRAQVLQLQAAGTTVLYITPTQLRLLTGSGETLPKVRLILCGGESSMQKPVNVLPGIVRRRPSMSFTGHLKPVLLLWLMQKLPGLSR